MAITEVTLLVSWFVLYIVLRGVNAYFGSALVFLTFIFAFIVSSQSFSSFYLLLYLVVIVLDLAINQISTTNQVAGSYKAGKFTAKGFSFIGISLVAGLAMYFVINLLSRQVGANIIGVPQLQITTPTLIAQSFKPVFEASLGIIENATAFVFFDILMVFGLLIPFVGLLIEFSGVIIPLIISSLIMAIFHVTAYSVAIALLLYAMMAFAMFIISRIILKDSLSADTAHYLNNGVISVSRSLQVVT